MESAVGSSNSCHSRRTWSVFVLLLFITVMPKGLGYLVCALLGAASYLVFLMLPPTSKHAPLPTKEFNSDVISALDADASDTTSAGSCDDAEPCKECGEHEVDVDVRTLTSTSVVDNESTLTSADAAWSLVNAPPGTVDKPQADEAGGKTRAQLLAQKLLRLDEELKRPPGPKRVQFRQGEGEAEPDAGCAEEAHLAGICAEEVAGAGACTTTLPLLGPFGSQAVGGAACTATPPLFGPFGDQVAGGTVCTATPPLLGPFGSQMGHEGVGAPACPGPPPFLVPVSSQGVGAPACPGPPPPFGPVSSQVCGLNAMYGLNLVTFVSGVPPPPDNPTAARRIFTQPGARGKDWGHCWQWKEKGWCAKGSSCRWAHPRDDEECSLHFAVMLDTSGERKTAGAKVGHDAVEVEKGRSRVEDGAAIGADAGAYLTDDGY